MNRPSSLIWMVFLFLLILLPTPAGKFIIDLAGGLILLITLIPLTIGGIGWIAWKRIQPKLKTCEACGSTFINNQFLCPVCGNNIKNNLESIENIPASSATIDIKPESID